MNPVAVPVDFRSVVHRVEAQQVETMLADSLGTLDNLLGCLRKELAQFRTQSPELHPVRRRIAVAARNNGIQSRREVRTNLVAHQVHTGGRLLANAVGNFRAVHGQHAPVNALPTRRPGTHSTPRERSSSV